MKTATKQETNGNGAKATRYPVSQIIILSAYERTFKSGKRGFFGKGVAPNGQKYQIIGAVEIAG